MNRTSSDVEAIDALLKDVDRLHTPPEIARSLLKLTSQDDFSVPQVADCMASDPGMSAKIMRVVNSSHYGLRHKASNLRQAITLLGARAVRMLALSFAIVEMFTQGNKRDWYYRYWRQALTMAVVAARIARRFDRADCHDAYTAGLLADLGSTVLAEARPSDYPSLAGRQLSGAELAAAEEKLFGFDHATVGARLLQRWSFPPRLILAVQNHHRVAVSPEHDSLARAVYAAGMMSDFLWNTGTVSREVFGTLLELFGCELGEFSELSLAVRDDIEMEARSFGFHLGCAESAEDLLARAQRLSFLTMLDTALTLDSFESLMDGPLGTT